MIAVPLLFGRLTAADYEEDVAADPRIDALRERMQCAENPTFTTDYLDPAKRSIANSVRIEFADGFALEETVEYPLGHMRRRSEGIPLLEAKFRRNLARSFGSGQQASILTLCSDQQRLEGTGVADFVNLFLPETEARLQ